MFLRGVQGFMLRKISILLNHNMYFANGDFKEAMLFIIVLCKFQASRIANINKPNKAVK